MEANNTVEFKNALINAIDNLSANDGSLADRVSQAIQWAWENYSEELVKPFYEGEKPESYTRAFMLDWIENEDFEIDQYEGLGL